MMERGFVLRNDAGRYFRRLHRDKRFFTPLVTLATHYSDSMAVAMESLLRHQNWVAHDVRIIELEPEKRPRVRLLSSRAERSMSRSSDWWRGGLVAILAFTLTLPGVHKMNLRNNNGRALAGIRVGGKIQAVKREGIVRRSIHKRG